MVITGCTQKFKKKKNFFFPCSIARYIVAFECREKRNLCIKTSTERSFPILGCTATIQEHVSDILPSVIIRGLRLIARIIDKKNNKNRIITLIRVIAIKNNDATNIFKVTHASFSLSQIIRKKNS